jgi:nucleotide-binding universal stress UspA family protein
MDIRRILFPTDFSACSRQALDHAIFLAREYDAELHMLNAVTLHAADPANPELHFPDEGELLERSMELAAEQMATLLDTSRRENLKVVEAQVRGFSPAALILEYAREQDVDVVVMGTHGRRGPARLFMGSVATEVVRHAECPVMTLRQSDPPREVHAVRRILVPLDFSDHSLVALAHGNDLARRYGASLELLHVVEIQTYPTLYGPVATVFDINAVKEVSLQAMDRAMRRMPGASAGYDKYVVGGRASTEIAAFANEHASDMVVISTHGLSGLERLLTGSTTEQVVRLVDCPVFTVKAFGKALVELRGEEESEAG